MKLNLLVKRNENMPFFIDLKSAIATNMSKSAFNKVQELNNELLGGYDYIAYADTDYTWWDRVNKYLTKSKLYYNQTFYADMFGNIERL